MLEMAAVDADLRTAADRLRDAQQRLAAARAHHQRLRARAAQHKVTWHSVLAGAALPEPLVFESDVKREAFSPGSQFRHFNSFRRFSAWLLQ